MTESAAPQPAVVEWGPEPRRAWPVRLGGVAAARWRDPRIAWVLAGVGGLGLFGSLVGEWQVTVLPGEQLRGPLGDEGRQEAVAQLPAIGGWGVAWLVGVVAIGSCAALTLRGLPSLRPAARSIGLAVAGPLLAVLVAVSVDISRESVLYGASGLSLIGGPELEVSLGRGHYAAYAGLALVAAALWWARPAVRPAPAGAGAETAAEEDGRGGGRRRTAPAEDDGRGGGRRRTAPAEDDGDGPADLTVTRAEPFSHLGNEHRWR